MLAQVSFLLAVMWLSVYLSVHLSHVGIVSKMAKRRIMQAVSSFRTPTVVDGRRHIPPEICVHYHVTWSTLNIQAINIPKE